MPTTDIAALAADVLRLDAECTNKLRDGPTLEYRTVCEHAAPALARQVQADAKRIAELEAALEQLSKCDLNDSNCASLEVASRRIRTIARAALKPKEQPHDD